MRYMRVQGEGWVWKWLTHVRVLLNALDHLQNHPSGMVSGRFFLLGSGWWWWCSGYMLVYFLKKCQRFVSRMCIKCMKMSMRMSGVGYKLRIEAAKMALPRKQVQVVGVKTGSLYHFS